MDHQPSARETTTRHRAVVVHDGRASTTASPTAEATTAQAPSARSGSARAGSAHAPTAQAATVRARPSEPGRAAPEPMTGPVRQPRSEARTAVEARTGAEDRADVGPAGAHTGTTEAPSAPAPADRVRDHAATRTEAPPSGLYVDRVKPVFDRLVGAVLLLVTLPVLLAAMALIRLTLGPDVVFRQQRVGRNGELFTVYKLRTMGHDRRDTTSEDLQALAEGRWDGIERRVTHKTDDDPRHTDLGRLLRKLSIDELPQLVNVVKGDMSLVGPRPELPVVVDRHYEPWMHRRHDVKPGVTGLWQISMRGDGAMHEHVDVDLDYVDRLSAREDLRILLATPLAALGAHKGA